MRKRPRYFKTATGKKIKTPVFFPDATKGVVKTLDSKDIERTKTKGVLVNTFHLFFEMDKNIIESFSGIDKFMFFKGAIISDSGGFQVMSVIKKNKSRGYISDRGIIYKLSKKRTTIFSPETSIQFQRKLGSDMLVVLDDFTPPGAGRKAARETVERTVDWATRSKKEFLRLCDKEKIQNRERPYLLAVVQGGEFPELRRECLERLVEIGFDGVGFGGWPIKRDGRFDYDSANLIAEGAPENYFLYGLGIGKPEEIVGCVELGYGIFDCVLPTRDARHKRLYIYNFEPADKASLKKKKFYSYYIPDKKIYKNQDLPLSTFCDCLLCTNYSRAYLYHLFKIGDSTALRLSTIHNLRFYSKLMETLSK